VLVPVEVVLVGLVPGSVLVLVLGAGLVWWCLRERECSRDRGDALVQWATRAISAENELNRRLEDEYGGEDMDGEEWKESGG
jgi:hypothetical protein